jgi:DNA-binding NarL/FixJ family response regulator
MRTSNYHRSKEVLQALVHGIDPENGTALPADAVLNRIDIVRALLAAIAALDAVCARAMRRAHLPESVGKKWSAEEEQQLKSAFAEGESVPAIAAKHRRTVRSIEDRLERLGLVQRDEHTNQNSFLGRNGSKEDQ